jgi:hypothetical protein
VSVGRIIEVFGGARILNIISEPERKAEAGMVVYRDEIVATHAPDGSLMGTVSIRLNDGTRLGIANGSAVWFRED